MDVPIDVLKIIAGYVVKHKMKLLDWIDLDKLNWSRLSGNINAIDLLEANPYIISWIMLSTNPNAIHLLEANQDKIYWLWFSENPDIFEPDINQINKAVLNQTIVLDQIIN